MFPLRNNKGRATGTGTVSNVRREAFKKKGMERENKNMGEEDKLSKEVDWEVEKGRNTKARKLSPEEVAEMMKPKEPQVKKEEVKKEGKGAVSLDKRENKRKGGGKSPSQMDEDEGGGPKKKGKGGHEGEIPQGKGKGKGKGQGKKGPKKGKEKKGKGDGSDTSLDQREVSQADESKSTTLDKSEVKQEAPAEPSSLDKSEVKPDASLDKSEAKTLGPSEAQLAKKDGKVRGWTQKGASLWEPSPSSPDWGGSESSDSGSQAAPLDKRGEAKVAKLGQIHWAFKPLLPEMVAIDFHNTLEVDDWVDEDTLHTLQRAGVKVWVISFGGHKRNQATIQTLSRYRGTLIAHLSFTSQKSGWYGKAQLMQKWGVRYIFDDNEEVCNECEAAGMEVYRIGWHSGQKHYKCLADAVEAFLDHHAEP